MRAAADQPSAGPMARTTRWVPVSRRRPDAGREVLGGELLAAAVEQDSVGGGAAGLLIEPFEEEGFGIEYLCVADDIAAGTLDVVGDEAIGGLGL